MVLHKILLFFLTYGQNPRSAEDLHLGVTEFPTNPAARNWLEEKQLSLCIAKDCLHEAMVRQASYADRQRHERKFSENQQVLVHRDHIGARGADGQVCAKLRHRRIGPFKGSEDAIVHKKDNDDAMSRLCNAPSGEPTCTTENRSIMSTTPHRYTSTILNLSTARGDPPDQSVSALLGNPLYIE